MIYRCVRLFVLFDLSPMMDMFRGKKISYFFSGVSVVFQCCSGVSLVFQWCCSGETPLQHHWNTTETPLWHHCGTTATLKHNWNTIETPLKHNWNTTVTPLKHHCNTETQLKHHWAPLNHKWNTTETQLKHHWNTNETLLQQQMKCTHWNTNETLQTLKHWNTTETPMKHCNNATMKHWNTTEIFFPQNISMMGLKSKRAKRRTQRYIICSIWSSYEGDMNFLMEGIWEGTTLIKMFQRSNQLRVNYWVCSFN